VLDDQPVASRWVDAKARLPWLHATKPGERSPFVSNFETPLIEQFLDGLGDRITELHVSAPFWDERLAALSRLSSEKVPRQQPNQRLPCLSERLKLHLITQTGELANEAFLRSFTIP